MHMGNYIYHKIVNCLLHNAVAGFTDEPARSDGRGREDIMKVRKSLLEYLFLPAECGLQKGDKEK